jgi:C1A family cysteine protease
MIYQSLLLAAVAASASASVTVDGTPIENIKMMFDQFKTDFQKKYASAQEEETRFQNFVETIRSIRQRNLDERAKGGSAQHGITKFSDLSKEEFKARYLTYTPISSAERSNATSVEIPKYRGTETNADWTGTYTTPVKNQGYCGSCWAFAASEQIESEAMRELQMTYVLSAQQLVECDRTSLGCNGGLQERAYNYVKRAGGIEQEVDYPYTSGAAGESETCSADKSKFVLTVEGYETIKTESAMTDYVLSTGPVSIAIDASTWSTYSGGILSNCGTDINHAVQTVGVDTEAGYWKVRNSWGEEWGESGYIRLAYGQDTCGITYDVTYVTGVKAV